MMSERPMDGTGALIRRDREGHPTEMYFGGGEVHGGYWVQQVDAWPHGPLQAQLDRIEEKLDKLLASHPGSPLTAELGADGEPTGMLYPTDPSSWTVS